jgi:hypothetical protein
MSDCGETHSRVAELEAEVHRLRKTVDDLQQWKTHYDHQQQQQRDALVAAELVSILRKVITRRVFSTRSASFRYRLLGRLAKLAAIEPEAAIEERQEWGRVKRLLAMPQPVSAACYDFLLQQFPVSDSAAASGLQLWTEQWSDAKEAAVRHVGRVYRGELHDAVLTAFQYLFKLIEETHRQRGQDAADDQQHLYNPLPAEYDAQAADLQQIPLHGWK